MEINNFSKRIKEMIARDQIDVAIKELSFLLRNSKLLDEVILASSRYNKLQKQIRMGIIDIADASITRNRIIIEMLEILNELGDSVESDEKLKEEVEKLDEPNISASKNVISGSSIHVGGNFHLGDVNLSTSGSTEDTNRIIEKLKKNKKSK